MPPRKVIACVRAPVAAGLLGLTAALGSTAPARAIDIACIEASKYEHLYRLFGENRDKFADYFQIDRGNVPDPGLCRAAIVTGTLQPMKRDTPRGESDYDKLLQFIAANRGWLATLYLASGGGSIGSGLRLGQITRLFWLKTVAVEATSVTYVPDFIRVARPDGETASPPEPQVAEQFAAGWQSYTQATRSLSTLDLSTTKGRCSSACTYIHVAGIDRRGRAYVHRGRLPANAQGEREGPDTSRSMAETLERLQRTEAAVVAHYRQMDAGDEAIRLFQSTSTMTVTPARVQRLPRYIADFMRARCKVDRAATKPQQMIALEHCVAAAHERERLLQFAKLCPKGCDRDALLRQANARARALFPATARDPRAPAR